MQLTVRFPDGLRRASRPAAISLILLLAGCGDGPAPVTGPGPGPGPDSLPAPDSIPVPVPAPASDLWTASGVPPTIIRLTASQLAESGELAPASAAFTADAELTEPGGIAFDTSGMFWIASHTDSVLVAFRPSEIPGSGSVHAAVVIRSAAGSLSGPLGLAFDRARGLWVANTENGTLVRYDAGALTTSGSPEPMVRLTGLGHPTGLAFDAGGSLWVSDEQARTVARYTAQELAASGSPAPAVILSGDFALTSPRGIAFDARGNLWVANGSRIVSFTPAQLAVTGAPDPDVVITPIAESLRVPEGLAFDADGSLWVMNAEGTLEKFKAADLTTTGAPLPAVQLEIDRHLLFWGIAFWPVPAGLPLN